MGDTQKKRDAGDDVYAEVVEAVRKRGLERMGLMTSWAWHDDPKRLAFMLSRYKFVSKMFDGKGAVLEVGCGDGFGSRVVRQSVETLVAVDFDPEFIETARETSSDQWPIEFRVHDMMSGPVSGNYDGVYCLDVLEHIAPEEEDVFLGNLISPLDRFGSCIIGMPSLQSQDYASKFSKLGHVNCKDQPSFRNTMSRYFHNVFLFSMNDEVVHTGFQQMSNYNLALCCGKCA